MKKPPIDGSARGSGRYFLVDTFFVAILLVPLIANNLSFVRCSGYRTYAKLAFG